MMRWNVHYVGHELEKHLCERGAALHASQLLEEPACQKDQISS